MSISLENFIKKAVADVRNAKKTGKKGRQARKNIKAGEATLQKTKELIRATAIACEQRAWKETRLIVRKYESTCSCCQAAKQSCTVIYLEQRHHKLGTIQRRLDEIQIYSFPHLPREKETVTNKPFICESCFLLYEHTAPQFKHAEPHPRVREPLSKWEAEYRNFSENYDRVEIRKLLDSYQPSQLLLEHKQPCLPCSCQRGAQE